MQDDQPSQTPFSPPDISSWPPEEVLAALMNELKRHVNSIKGWAVILAQGFHEETYQKAIESLTWNVEQMEWLMREVRGYLENYGKR